MKTTDNVLTNLQLYIAGDFNIDLLKIHEKPIFGDYFDAITGHSFPPKITLPTRFSKMNGALIDNFLYKISHRLLKTSAGIIPLSHYTAITRSWRGDVNFLRAPWDRRKMQKIVAYYFPFSHHGDVTASLRRLWCFYGDSTKCYLVPAEL